MAAEDSEVGDAFETELTGLLTLRQSDAEEVCAIDVVEIKGRTRIGAFCCDFYVGELEVFDVASVDTCGRKIAEHRGFGIFVGVLLRLDCGHLGPRPADLMQIDIADLQVFDGVVGYSRDDGW